MSGTTTLAYFPPVTDDEKCFCDLDSRSIIDNAGIPSVTLMLHSSHVRMLNEAIVALTVMTASLASDVVDDNDADATLIHRNLHIDLVINGIKRCFCDESLTVPPEIKVRLHFSIFIGLTLKFFPSRASVCSGSIHV